MFLWPESISLFKLYVFDFNESCQISFSDCKFIYVLTIFETYRHNIGRLEGRSKIIAAKLDKKDGMKETVKTLNFPKNRLKY